MPIPDDMRLEGLPYHRLKRVAIAASMSQECPTETHECWRFKEVGAFGELGPLHEIECRECWTYYILKGV